MAKLCELWDPRNNLMHEKDKHNFLQQNVLPISKFNIQYLKRCHGATFSKPLLSGIIYLSKASGGVRLRYILLCFLAGG